MEYAELDAANANFVDEYRITYAKENGIDHIGANYFDAGDTTALNGAFASITSDIEKAGYGAVEINDGTTANVTTSTGVAHLLTVDTSSFEYYKNGSVWDDAPEAELNDKGEVVWNLGSGVLDNGVVYKVTFNVWPSQYTLDLIADLKNGNVKYENLDENVQQYLVKGENGEYDLATNTVASIKYTDTRTDNGPQTGLYVNPPKVATESYRLNIEKKWANALDSRDIPTAGMTLEVFKDGTKVDEVVVNELLKWKNHTEIAVGIMKYANNKVTILETGHDYSLAEPINEEESLPYHWELDSQVVRPMLINNVLTVLIKDEGTKLSSDHETVNGKEYYRINGVAYYVDNTIQELVATNNRRSYLEFNKQVTGEHIPEHAKFEYTVKVTNSMAELNEDDKEIWFSVYDTVNKTTVLDVETSATVANNEGYYKVPSGTEFTVELEAGWNLRILNLPTGSTYSIEETKMPNGFIFNKVEGLGVKDNTKKLVEGKIEHFNTPYSISFTNEYRLTDVTVTKTWVDGDNQDGIRPEALALTLKGDGEVVTSTPAVVKEGNTWTYTWTALPRYNATGEVSYTVEENAVPEGYRKAVDGLTVTNTHDTAKADVTITKKWADDGNREAVRPSSVTLQLLADGEEVGEPVIVTGTGDVWTYTFDQLPVNAGGKTIEYTVNEENVPAGYRASYDGLTVTNTHDIVKVSRSVLKDWDDGDNQDGKRPENVTVKLLADNVEIASFVLSDENDWTATKDGLPKYKKVMEGEIVRKEEIKYTWTEVLSEEAVNNKYTLKSNTVSEDDETLTILVNSRDVDETSATVVKVWKDDSNRDGKRPEKLKVYLNGEEKVLTAENGWTMTIDHLPVNKDGKPITYTWTEEAVSGYTSDNGVVEGTITTFTNSKPNETVDVAVKKVWVDGSNRDLSRPQNVTLQLYANGEKYGDPVTFNGTGDEWTYSFGKLNKNENGKVIEYTVKEENVPAGYTKAEDGLTVTNTRPTEKTSVTVSKQWVDGGNRDLSRPNKLTVTLKDGETVVATHDLVAKEDWTYTFTGLEKNRNGKPIAYDVVEESVPGYTPEKVGDYTTGIRFTNTYKAEEVNFSGIKEWRDGNDQDGIRPDSVTVLLMAGEGEDQEEVARTYATVDNNWSYSFTGIPKNENGVAIKYIIKELPVDGYETTYEGSTIVNTHATATTTVSGTKTWVDGDNQDGLQPASITVKLKADGEYVLNEDGSNVTATASANNNWTYTFGTLPAKKAGKAIVYTVEEVVPSGYNASYDGYNITNTHTPETFTIKTSKEWKDEDNNDRVRPTSIKINLLVNGEVVDYANVGARDNWSAEFVDLPKYENGKEIAYTITEDPVDGYTSKVEGYKVTNTHELQTTTFTVTKVWNDKDNQDGKRPESVTIKLLANGTEVKDGVVTLDGTEETAWSYTWTGLQKLENGEPIVYTVVEVEEVTEETVGEDEEVETNGYSATYEYTKTEDEKANVSAKVINTYDPEKTTYTVTKTWVDDTDRDGLRPDTITVELFANDDEKATATAELTAAGGWTYTFEDLDAYRDGSLITYTVKEVEVDGYESKVEGNKITNTHEIETVDVLGTVIWDDEDNKDEIRPDEVEVCVYANGEKVACTTVDPDDEWKYEFEDLPKNDNGEEIEYTVGENDIDDYETKIEKYDITNKHVPDDGEVLGEDEEFPDGQGTDNPATGDTILPFALLLLTSLGGISITAKKIVDRQK